MRPGFCEQIDTWVDRERQTQNGQLYVVTRTDGTRALLGQLFHLGEVEAMPPPIPLGFEGAFDPITFITDAADDAEWVNAKMSGGHPDEEISLMFLDIESELRMSRYVAWPGLVTVWGEEEGTLRGRCSGARVGDSGGCIWLPISYR